MWKFWKANTYNGFQFAIYERRVIVVHTVVQDVSTTKEMFPLFFTFSNTQANMSWKNAKRLSRIFKFLVTAVWIVFLTNIPVTFCEPFWYRAESLSLQNSALFWSTSKQETFSDKIVRFTPTLSFCEFWTTLQTGEKTINWKDILEMEDGWGCNKCFFTPAILALVLALLFNKQSGLSKSPCRLSLTSSLSLSWRQGRTKTYQNPQPSHGKCCLYGHEETKIEFI